MNPTDPIGCLVAARALLTEAERRYEVAVDALVKAQAAATECREHCESLIALADEAARRVTDELDAWLRVERRLEREEHERRLEREEHERGIAAIRARRLAREAEAAKKKDAA